MDIITAMFGDVAVHQADLPRLLDDGPWVLPGLVVLGSYWDYLLPGELASQVLEGLLFLAELCKYKFAINAGPFFSKSFNEVL